MPTALAVIAHQHLRLPAAGRHATLGSRMCSSSSSVLAGSRPFPAAALLRTCRDGSCRSLRQRVAVAAASGGSDVKPAYNRYRSRADIEASYLRQWKEVTARGEAGQTRMTVQSAVACVPLWAKYTLAPESLRFIWWLLWARIAAVWHIFHRWGVLQGAKLDIALAKRSGNPAAFSRAVVMRRYHRNIGLLDSWRYRLGLLKGEGYRSQPQALNA